MRTDNMWTRLMLPAVVLAVGTALACDDTDPVVVTTDETLTTQLQTAIDDEYRAEAIYLRVLADFGSVLPFVNVVQAEERHSVALARLFVNRGMEIPANAWNTDNVPAFATIAAACQGAVVAELANIDMYDQLFAGALPADVQQVFTNNRRASLERHLPAFQQCS